MLRYVYGQDEIVARFVAQLIPHCRERGLGKCKAIGVVDDEGKLIAGIAYHNWDPEAGVIEISGAALPRTNWLTRETIRRMYEFPFVQCECQMVVKRVRADDEQLLRQLAVGGFMFVRVPRMFGRQLDGVLALLTQETWASSPFIKHPLDGSVDAIKEAA